MMRPDSLKYAPGVLGPGALEAPARGRYVRYAGWAGREGGKQVSRSGVGRDEGWRGGGKAG